MKIKKRSGELEDFNPSKIQARIKNLSDGLDIDVDTLVIETQQSLYDGMASYLIDDQISRLCANKVTTHPDYSYLGTRVLKSNHERFIKIKYNSQLDCHFHYSQLKDKFSDDYKRKYEAYGIKLWEAIKGMKYENQSYFSWMTVYYGYLLLNEFEDKVESMELMLYRVSLAVTKNYEEALETFELLVTKKKSEPSPVLFNACITDGQYSSCVLIHNYGDSQDELMDTFRDVCKYSSNSSGIGLFMSNIRSKNTLNSRTNRKSSGYLRKAKMYNEASRFYHQGSRNGSFAMYLDIWHADIMDHIKMTLNTGNNELRTRDLYTGLLLNDVFMSKLESGDAKWYLFCPHEVLKITNKMNLYCEDNDIVKPSQEPLYNIYGDEFAYKYKVLCSMADAGLLKHELVNTEDLWNQVITSQQESGMPYTLHRDSVNKKSNHKNIGVIKQSNLCIEILEYTDENTIATCNLASIPVNAFFTKKIELSQNLTLADYDALYDWKELRKVARVSTRNLNTILDINHYINPKAEEGYTSQRSLGIGIQGLADLFIKMKIPFTSEIAKYFNKKIYETIYLACLTESNRLAKEEGIVYGRFEGSPFSQGEFQFDMWGLSEADLIYPEEWRELKASVIKYGTANSLLGAQMPTASSSGILDNSESNDPITYVLFNRKVISGEYLLINEDLVRDLIDLGIWNKSMKSALLTCDGSISKLDIFKIFNLDDLTLGERIDLREGFEKLKSIYKNVWEISQKELIYMSADRGPFIDQTQSFNLHISDGNRTKIHSALMLGWKLGLKTGSYYVRTEPAATADKSLATSSTGSKEVLKSKFSKDNGCEDCSG